MDFTGPSDQSEPHKSDLTNTKQSQAGKSQRARDRELERKRARGEVSCAECRRLKLKCNKKVPCASCIRRGCHTICPNGLLTTGQGSRFVLANTDKLHEKLLEMSKRIRQLEDALQIAQASFSSAAHPLLSDDLLSIKSGVDRLSTEKQEKEGEREVIGEEEELTTAFGTLTVSERGETRFVGRVAADMLLVNEPSDEALEQLVSNPNKIPGIDVGLPDSIMGISRGFPLAHAHLPKGQLMSLIRERLPTYERATALAEAYLENVSWLPRPIQRDQIFEDLIPLIYKGRRAGSSTPPSGEEEESKYDGVHRMHNLALVLAVFACGAAGDLTKPPVNAEGELYIYLARAALCTNSIIADGASLETVQTIVLLASYDFFACSQATLESSWKTISFALVLASSIGLHRDPAHWNMEYKYMQRRRAVFWDIMALDKFKSLGTGRPSIFRLNEVDCKFPEENNSSMDRNRMESSALTKWRLLFIKEIIGPISEHMCLVRPIKFAEIMEFDRKIRDFEESPTMLRECGSTTNVREQMWRMHREIVSLTYYSEYRLLFIHRNFFALAMIKHSGNPLRSPFAPSFLAAYASAIKLLRIVRSAFDQNSQVVLRQWPLWAHSLTSAVIVGSVASKIKQASLAIAAFNDLNNAIALFEEGIVHPVAKRGLPIILRLRDRAKVSLLNLARNDGEPPLSGVSVTKSEKDEADKELDLLRGTARLVRRTGRKKVENTGCEWCPSPSSSNDNPGTPESGGTSSGSFSTSLPMSDPASLQYQLPVDSPNFARHHGPPHSSTPDTTHFTSNNLGMGIQNQSDPNIAGLFSNQPPPAIAVDQDLVSLLNSIYNDSPVKPNTGMENLSSFNGPLQGQASQIPAYGASGSDMQNTDVNGGEQMWAGLPANIFNPQFPLEDGSSITSQNNDWFSKVLSENVFGQLTPMADSSSIMPSYDPQWSAGDEIGLGGVSETVINSNPEAAQFVADWRMQAALSDGPQFIPDAEMDLRSY